MPSIDMPSETIRGVMQKWEQTESLPPNRALEVAVAAMNIATAIAKQLEGVIDMDAPLWDAGEKGGE